MKVTYRHFIEGKPRIERITIDNEEETITFKLFYSKGVKDIKTTMEKAFELGIINLDNIPKTLLY